VFENHDCQLAISDDRGIYNESFRQDVYKSSVSDLQSQYRTEVRKTYAL
jgi:hypothetical protein